ncbi:tRNA N6-adenosine threonylcarbamoyltransferase [Candidatus Clavichlamydia salmonicola]|uniref:tRNA (adenosine(37)-N6)-threonylcarbamoyltransferase complex transferase subunit TsaD n=1 Tax=Candidatus Clavichlamydia salmonicola TaxID=469812 RepID=UPI001890EB7B|nr:tRNA (adenosine(37)-N6)-threonylcarbamoyltransferase complex transferase subunit TsaD [Candidatus Clavichlamydia salmonicola]MBF5051178.1 tRNA N6-adenosine threonylcarbamoyltransferase [Candidatus Clavichlamydia salmonicola]
MLILGLESTCDETACAVIKDGKEILSNCIASQESLHAPYGGVVPEIAAREHARVFPDLLQKALKIANVSLADIDLITVASSPGLIGALSTGVNFARGLSIGTKKKLIGVNHVEAHLYAAIMSAETLPMFPSLGIVLSGGHTVMFLMKSHIDYEVIGMTVDDAIGEAFDKAARILDLPYPGGPSIEKLATHGDVLAFSFKAGEIKGRPYDFSFSGLKTAILYAVKGQGNKSSAISILHTDQDRQNVAASFQHAAFSKIIDKCLLAINHFSCKALIIGGGVASNSYFRSLIEKKINIPSFLPPKNLCTDNAVMIAGYGYSSYLAQGIISKNITISSQSAWKKYDFL